MQARRRTRLAAQQQDLADACRLLELDLPVEDVAEVRQAYLRKIRVAHPDVNPFTDTTDEAVEIIEAYEAVLEVRRLHLCPDTPVACSAAACCRRHLTSNGSAGAAAGHDTRRCLLPDLQAVGSRQLDAAPDAFDAPEGPANELFVNPWACGVSPLDWELLQQVWTSAVHEVPARAQQTDMSTGCAMGQGSCGCLSRVQSAVVRVQVARAGPGDPEAALLRAGVAVRPGAVHWLTPGQLAAARGLLAGMEEALHDWQPAEWLLTDCLLRARAANPRAPRT